MTGIEKLEKGQEQMAQWSEINGILVDFVGERFTPSFTSESGYMSLKAARLLALEIRRIQRGY